MLLDEVKAQLGIAQFNLNTAEDEAGNKTEWMRHWDNDNRVAVSLHKDTVAKIQADPTTNLGIQTEEREGSKGKYTAHRIVAYTPTEVVL